MLFNYALNYAIRRVQVTQDGLKIKGTHQLLVYAHDVNILGGIVHAIKENAEVFVVVSKEIGLGDNGIKLSIWHSLEVRIPEEITE